MTRMRRTLALASITTLAWAMFASAALAATNIGQNVYQEGMRNLQPVWKLGVAVGALVVLFMARNPKGFATFFIIVIITGIAIFGVNGLADWLKNLAPTVTG